MPIDPGDYGAPDPADLMNPDGGLSSLLTAAQDVEAGKQVRDGKVVLSSFTGTVPGKDVAAVIPSAKESATFDATFTVTDQDELAKAVLTGPVLRQGRRRHLHDHVRRLRREAEHHQAVTGR